MNILSMERWHLTEWQRNKVDDEFVAQAVECHEIAKRHCDLVKEQYEALARQWLIVAAQRNRAA